MIGRRRVGMAPAFNAASRVKQWAGAPAAPGTRALLVLAFAVVLMARLPGVILHGRLWAEEGRFFFVNAASMRWYQALAVSFAGYLNIVASAAPIVARHLVRLEYVPWVETGIALFFQCCPAILLACARDPWLRRRTVLAAALLLLATPPLTEEVWLQTLASQFHLALCAALILALDLPARRVAVFGGVLLFLAPLCGPAASALLPLFLARSFLERSRGRLLQGVALGAGTGLQLALFYQHEAGRSYGIGPIVLLCVIYIKQIVTPLLGRNVAKQASAVLQARLAAGLFPWQPVLVTLAMFAACCVVLLRSRQAAAIWLFLAACLTCWIAYFGAIGGGLGLLAIGGGGRYTFLPEVLSALALLAVAAGRPKPERWVARAGVVWLLVVGVMDLQDSYYGSGPDWASEVLAWRQDHRHRIATWPAGWVMTLKSE